jgi:hypothetical protein
MSEILVTYLDESWTRHIQLGLTMVRLAKIFGNVFWTCQIKLIQVSLIVFIKPKLNSFWFTVDRLTVLLMYR